MESASISNRFAQLRLRHLTLLDLIFEEGSLSKVAERLCVTQPAVTTMLQEMEAILGAQLVDRGRQGARLTAEGGAVRSRLRLPLNILNGLEADLGMAPKTHHLRVGVLTNAMLEIIPNAVAQLRSRGFEVTFQFVETTVESVIAGVLDGSLECAIGRIDSGILRSGEQSRLAISEIQKVPMRVVCAPDNPIGKLQRVSLKLLQKQEWVLLPRGSQTREAFDQAFIQQGLIPPLPVAELLSFYTNFHLVNKTDLLTIAPETALEYLATMNIVRAVAYRWPIALSPLMFFCLEERTEIDAIAAFRQAVLSA